MNQRWRSSHASRKSENNSKTSEVTKPIKPTGLNVSSISLDEDEISTRPLSINWSDLHGSSKENLTEKVTIPYQSGITSTTNSLSQSRGVVTDLDIDNLSQAQPLDTSTPEELSRSKENPAVRPKVRTQRNKTPAKPKKSSDTPRASKFKVYPKKL